MTDELRGKRIAFLVANEGVEQIELTEPLAAVREAGAEASLLAPEEGEVKAFNHLDKGDTFSVDSTVASAGDCWGELGDHRSMVSRARDAEDLRQPAAISAGSLPNKLDREILQTAL